VLLFDGGNAPLAPFGPGLSAKAASTLQKLGAEQHMHSIVTQVDADGLSVRTRRVHQPARVLPTQISDPG
jgi:NADH dehydrogenase